MAKVKITTIVAGATRTTNGGAQAISISNLGTTDCSIIDHYDNTTNLKAGAGIDLPDIGGKSYPSLTINALESEVLIIEIR